MSPGATALKIPLEDGGTISALLSTPEKAWACYVFAHGAGAGMHHAFMDSMASGLADRAIACLRFQFPYMEQAGRRPDPPGVAHAAIRAAVHEATKRLPALPLFAGGKSYGGRMTSQAQAAEPLANVRGIIFVGFPLHPAGKPSTLRAEHLAEVHLPMLFLQGTRDALADLALMKPATAKLGSRATLHIVEGGDHSFKVLARSGRNDEQVRQELLDTMASWMKKN